MSVYKHDEQTDHPSKQVMYICKLVVHFDLFLHKTMGLDELLRKFQA